MGDPGIEPGMGLPGGVTVRCRTLQHVARRRAEIAKAADGVNWKMAEFSCETDSGFASEVAGAPVAYEIYSHLHCNLRMICIYISRDFVPGG